MQWNQIRSYLYAVYHSGLYVLGKVTRRYGEVPCEMTTENMKRRIEICQKLLTYPNDQRYLTEIVSCDENLVFYHYPETRNPWIDK